MPTKKEVLIIKNALRGESEHGPQIHDQTSETHYGDDFTHLRDIVIMDP